MLQEQTDGSLRSTLIFRNVPEEKNEKSWDDTTKLLVSHLSKTFNWAAGRLHQDIERAHRGREQDVETEKKQKNRAIYVKFMTWRVSEDIKKQIITANRSGKTKIIVSQMYSKQTTEVMNDKLKIRKDIIANNPTWKMSVKYPGILMVKKKDKINFSVYTDDHA